MMRPTWIDVDLIEQDSTQGEREEDSNQSVWSNDDTELFLNVVNQLIVSKATEGSDWDIYTYFVKDHAW